MRWYIYEYVLHVHGGVHVCCICLCKSVYICMYKCMHDYKCEYCVYLGVCMIMCMYVYTRIYICIGVCTCAFLCTCGYMCLIICYIDADLFVHSELDNRRPRLDLNLCSLWTRYAGYSKIDPKMIRRFVPVRTVETRRWFDFKTAPFHVSICLLVYFNFSVLS